jgi:hypothetical protein
MKLKNTVLCVYSSGTDYCLVKMTVNIMVLIEVTSNYAGEQVSGGTRETLVFMLNLTGCGVSNIE